MSGPAPEFTVERFERVDASSGMSLLRLSGAGLGIEPVLMVDDGGMARRVRALPDPMGATDRAAFAVPSSVFDSGRAAFALDIGGFLLDLPVPAPRLPDREKLEQAATDASRRTQQVLAAGAAREQELLAEIAALREALGDTETIAQEEMDARIALEDELEQLRRSR
jgi:hypothetical protein